LGRYAKIAETGAGFTGFEEYPGLRMDGLCLRIIW
jgi:hypothetical protein